MYRVVCDKQRKKYENPSEKNDHLPITSDTKFQLGSNLHQNSYIVEMLPHATCRKIPTVSFRNRCLKSHIGLESFYSGITDAAMGTLPLPRHFGWGHHPGAPSAGGLVVRRCAS